MRYRRRRSFRSRGRYGMRRGFRRRGSSRRLRRLVGYRM